MTAIWDQLKKSFTDDHQAMIRGYRSLLGALNDGDFAAASRLSVQLDRSAGPHIEFEEQYLYPAVKASRGTAYVSKLYQEHRQVLAAITELRKLTAESIPSDEELAAWKQSLESGLEHAASCGTLLSHLEVLSEEQQRSYLDTIHRLRDEGHLWSELEQLKIGS